MLDLVSQVHNVVLMNVYLGLGNSGGSGFWNGGYMSQGREMGSQFTSNLDTRWTDPVTARRVPSKWRGCEWGAKGNGERQETRGLF